jgi:hypothetical protein
LALVAPYPPLPTLNNSSNWSFIMKSRHPSAFGSPFTEQLKAKGRGRRETLGRLAAASRPVKSRNDLLPQLSVSYLSLSALRPSARKLRRLDPAHVREIANAIATLGLSIGTQLGPRIGAEKGPLSREARRVAFAAAELVGVAQPRRTRWREARWFDGQARFLKRQLSLPVSTMSQ